MFQNQIGCVSRVILAGEAHVTLMGFSCEGHGVFYSDNNLEFVSQQKGRGWRHL